MCILIITLLALPRVTIPALLPLKQTFYFPFIQGTHYCDAINHSFNAKLQNKNFAPLLPNYGSLYPNDAKFYYLYPNDVQY